MISTYNNTHVGHLPVRVLQHNIIHQFENTYPGFLTISQSVIHNLGLSNEIEYHANIDANHGDSVKGPCVEIERRVIHLQETFLAYMWCMCFVLLQYTNNLVKHAIDDNGNVQQDIMTGQLLDYALTILRCYKDWDKSLLLNPEEYSVDDRNEIEKINAIFIHATNFTMCHEFSHVEQNHVGRMADSASLSQEEKREFEMEADKRAIELMLHDSESLNINEAPIIGITMGVCAILFLRDTVVNRIHPDNDVRILNAIELLHVEENDHPWIIACAAINLWTNVFKIDLIWEEKRNFKELFYFLSMQI